MNSSRTPTSSKEWNNENEVIAITRISSKNLMLKWMFLAIKEAGRWKKGWVFQKMSLIFLSFVSIFESTCTWIAFRSSFRFFTHILSARRAVLKTTSLMRAPCLKMIMIMMLMMMMVMMMMMMMMTTMMMMISTLSTFIRVANARYYSLYNLALASFLLTFKSITSKIIIIIYLET